MRDFTSRIPDDVRAELERVAGVLEPAVQAMRDLDRLRTEVELALDVPASLDPDELAEPSPEEWLHATDTAGLGLALELADAIRDRLPGLFLTADQ